MSLMFQRLLRILRPKGREFFHLFSTISGNVATMSEDLAKLFQEENTEQIKEIIAQIDDLEHKTDSLTHQVFIELSQNFITPFDRDDIYKLTSSLDDIADSIHGCSKRLSLYDVDVKDPYFKIFSDLIQTAAHQVHTLIGLLHEARFSKEVERMVIEINVLENKGDDTFNESIQCLFQNEADVRMVIKKKEIYQILEATIDRCEDVANIVESILLKEN